MTSSMGVRATGELFQHRYYRINTMVLKLTGQWPYQSTRTRSIIYAGTVLLCVSHLIPQLTVLMKNFDDWGFLIECVTPLIFGGYCLVKYMFSAINSNKMLMLLNRMHTDWNVLARDCDVDTLHEYAKKGRKMTIMYAVGFLTTCILFGILPIVPKIIDLLLRNGTEPGVFAIPVDYLIINEQKYYFYIVLHYFMVVFLVCIIVVGHDSLLAVYVQHVCGLFAALGNKLERIGKTKKSAGTYEIGNAFGKNSTDFNDVAACVCKHNEAIEYAELIEATYSCCLFFIMGFNIFLITLTGLQVVMITAKPQEYLRFVATNVFSTMQLYAECYVAQIMMDHSINIRYSVLGSKWYRLPLKDQKSLLLLVMRCNVPCNITAGKVSVISMETFGVILKTSLSYFTVLRSL